jgi:hypothetical protein
MVFSFTAKRDRWFVPLVLIAAVLPLAAAAVFIAVGGTWIGAPVAVLVALLLVLIVLNLRSNTAMMAQAQGQPGAVAQIVEAMRGDWRVHAGFAATTQLDFVHLVVGRPGVILLAEGHPSRVRGLLGQEKRRLSKIIGNADMRDFVVGSNEGELPVAKVRRTLMRLPRSITGAEVNALDARLTALSARPQMPKGAIPKHMRPPNLRIPRR